MFFALVKLESKCLRRSGYSAGSVVIFAINLHRSTVRLKLNSEFWNQPIDQYLLKPKHGNITSKYVLTNHLCDPERTIYFTIGPVASAANFLHFLLCRSVLLNGNVLKMINKRTIPNLLNLRTRVSEILLPSLTYGFFVPLTFRTDLCQS